MVHLLGFRSTHHLKWEDESISALWEAWPILTFSTDKISRSTQKIQSCSKHFV